MSEEKKEKGEELEITDLVKSQKNIETKQEEYFDNLFKHLEDLESKLSNMDQIVTKLNDLEAKVEKYRPKTPEEKLAEVMKTAMDNTNFNAPLVANYLINFAPHYTQDKVMELIEALLTYQYMKYNEDWDMSAETSYGLIKARDWFRTLAENDQLELEMY